MKEGSVNDYETAFASSSYFDMNRTYLKVLRYALYSRSGLFFGDTIIVSSNKPNTKMHGCTPCWHLYNKYVNELKWFG